MKKNIIVLLVTLFGFSNVTFSAVCGTSGTKTVFPTSTGYDNGCSAEPDYFELKIYDMMLCTSAPTAPTSSATAVTTSCQTVVTSTSGSSVSVVKGSNAELGGVITRPANGTYTHAYIRISNDFIIKDSRQFSTGDINDGADEGDWCATTSSGVDCETSEVTAVKRTIALKDFTGGGVYSLGDISTSEGTLNAYLVDSAELLGKGEGADTVYLVGTQVFTTPVVITDASTTMNASFATTTGITIYNNGSEQIKIVSGPFSLKLTVE